MARFLTKEEKERLLERKAQNRSVVEEHNYKNFYRDARDYEGVDRARDRRSRTRHDGARRRHETEYLKNGLDYEARREPHLQESTARSRSRRRARSSTVRDSEEELFPKYNHRDHSFRDKHGSELREEHRGRQRRKLGNKNVKTQSRSRLRSLSRPREAYKEENDDDDDDGVEDWPSRRDSSVTHSHRRRRRRRSMPDTPPRYASGAGSFRYFSDHARESWRENPAYMPRNLDRRRRRC